MHRLLLLCSFSLFALCQSASLQVPQLQQFINGPIKKPSEDHPEDNSHLSRWCIESKTQFLDALKNGGSNEWVVVLGNEAADTDSMVSSMAFAYHLAHRKKNPEKAVALLQIEQSAIDLRPENTLVLKRSRMGAVHEDLLTLDQLPYHRGKIAQMIKGIAVVDHNRPLSYWRAVPVLAIIDHHADRGVNSTAAPRLIESTGSASSLVTKVILEDGEIHDTITRSLADLLLTTIALDTNGLKKGIKIDHKSAKGLFPYSSYAKDKFKKTMKTLAKDMKSAREEIDALNVTQLYARDYKGDMVYNSTIPILVGYSNVPVSFDELIARSSNQTREGLFHESRQWVVANEIDLLIVMTKFKNEKGEKERELILVVKHGQRLTEEEAERLYHKVRHDMANSDELQLLPWKNEKEWGHQRYAWKQGGSGEGRKTIRPIVEKAIQEW